jgi:hypothetical protein
MNPVNLLPETLGRILARPVIDFIEEIEGDVDASKVFFEAQEQAKEKAEQAKKNYDNFEENSKQPFAPKFFCPEFQEPEPERRSSSEESARSPFPDPDSKHKIKRGFGLAEHPSLQSLSSLTINPPLQKGVQELIKKFDDPEANKKSASRIGEMVKILTENTQKLRAKTSEDHRQELEIKENPKFPTENPPKNFKNEIALLAKLEFNESISTQNYIKSVGNQGVGKKFGKESNTQHSAQRSIISNKNGKRFKILETICEETSEETYQLNPGNLQQNFEIGVTAELGFNGDNYSNQSYVISGGGPENCSQNESEVEIKSSCLEKLSCVRLENLNKNCSIS